MSGFLNQGNRENLNTRHSSLLHNFDPVCLYKIMSQKNIRMPKGRESNAELSKTYEILPLSTSRLVDHDS